jgi:sulfur-carrier protein
MLSVVFFASVREQLGCGRIELEWEDSLASFAGLQAHLSQQKGPGWAEVLNQNNIIRAVNQVVVDSDMPLKDGDEVAFFPPVTGG